MYEVYRHHDSARVGLVDGLLRNAGIETFIRNWAGSNITEIPIPSIFPEVCVLKEGDLVVARHIVQAFLSARQDEGKDWTCKSCGEIVDGFLGECWSCGTASKHHMGDL